MANPKLMLLLLFVIVYFFNNVTPAFHQVSTIDKRGQFQKVVRASFRSGRANNANPSSISERMEQSNAFENPVPRRITKRSTVSNLENLEHLAPTSSSRKIIRTSDEAYKTNQRNGMKGEVIEDNNVKTSRHVLRFETQKLLFDKGFKMINKAKNDNMKHKDLIKKCQIYNYHQLKVANCSYLQLKEVPQDLPSNINILLLSNNVLDSNALHRGPFGRYKQLKSLDLKFNNISSLPNNSFQGLPSLRYLSLHSNNIIMDRELNQSIVFAPLKHSLKKLVLNNNTKILNSPGLAYPDKALSYLTSLQALEIDGLPNKTFGFHFLTLTKLYNLSLEGYYTGRCSLGFVQNDTFEHLPYLKSLIIADCKIDKNKVEIAVFEPLTNLEYLDVSYNYQLGLDGLGKLMYGQKDNKHLKRIKMTFVSERYEPCIIIYKENLEYFQHLHLESIDINHNNIEMIEYGALKYLPQTLKTVNLTRNNIMFGAYWEHLKDMSNLECLYLDGFDRAYAFPLHLPPKDINCPRHKEIKMDHYAKRDTETKDQYLTLSLPPKLLHITMRRYSLSYNVDKIVFHHVNILYSVDLHGNYLPKLRGPIYGLNNLKHLDISSCFVAEISRGFFSNFNNLATLNLYGNALGETVQLDSTTSIFASDSLKKLDLGANNIVQLSKDVFKDCSNLTTLLLSENILRDIGSSMDNLPKLTHLYLSSNSLNTLPKTLMNHFQRMIDSGKKVFIDMTLNPISCNCHNIDFLQWISRTNVFGRNYTNYYCYFPEQQTRKSMNHGFDEELKLLTNECADNTKLFICVISATIAFFLILISVIIFRFRWTMRYWYYVVKVMATHKKESIEEKKYDYDVFVCYCHQDKNFIAEELNRRLGTERDIKLLMHEKCFQAGQKIAESILMAVQQSRKTLVVISKAMLDSSWCNYELEMARQESVSTGRDALVILFLEKIPISSMNLDMVNYIRSNVIVTYPGNDPEEQEEFWNKLADDLKSS